MSEEKKRVNAVIDMDLYVRIVEAGYGVSEAVTKGFEKLLDEPTNTNTQDNSSTLNDGFLMGLQVQVKELQGQNETLKKELEKAEKDKEDLKALNLEITRLKESLSNSPDPVELAEVKAHFEGLQRLVEEKERLIEEKEERIKDLNREVETLNVFAHYFKNVEVKQIEAPTAEKKSLLARLKFW